MASTHIFHFGDPGTATALFWFFCGIGVCLAIIVYMVAANPQYRREQWRDGEPRPGCGTFFGVCILIFFLWFGYRTTFGRFFRLELVSDQITLHYRFPEREVTLALNEIQKVRIRREKTSRSLMLYDVDGRYYRSSQCGYQCREKLAELRELGFP